MALIFFASSLSDPGAPPGGMSDKTAHFLIYGALGGALMRALAGGRSAAMTRGDAAGDRAGTLYGVSDEIHQYFVPSHSRRLDVAADVAGHRRDGDRWPSLRLISSRVAAGLTGVALPRCARLVRLHCTIVAICSRRCAIELTTLYSWFRR